MISRYVDADLDWLDLERLKSNDCHNPAGSSDGGQFCGGEGGGGEPMSSHSALYDYQNYAHGKINRDLR